MNKSLNTAITENPFSDIDKHRAKVSILNLLERGIIERPKDGLFHPEEEITTEEFVTWLIRSTERTEGESDNGFLGYMDYAYRIGIIEDYDMIHRINPMERRSAARILHEALLSVFGEADEKEWKAAEELLDLYSCRTCVMHIAQIYVKGIMSPKENNTFDGNGTLTRGEAAEVFLRMLDPEQRIGVSRKEYKCNRISPDEAWEILRKEKGAILIDVRTKEEYEAGHIEKSVNIPLDEIHRNPLVISDRRDTPITLYCQMGYKSAVAAQILLDAGYRKIYTIPGIGQYQYHLTT